MSALRIAILTKYLKYLCSVNSSSFVRLIYKMKFNQMMQANCMLDVFSEIYAFLKVFDTHDWTDYNCERDIIV